MGVITPTNKEVVDFKGLHLFHAGVSNCSMRVRLTLEEKKLPWTSHHVDLFKKENQEAPEIKFTPNPLQIAISTILVRTAKIDDEFHILEEQKIIDLLVEYFSISKNDSAELLSVGLNEEKDATDLYSYTSIIKKELSLQDRKKILEMMWQIIVTDQNFDPYENNLVWRVAELIGIATRERVQIKKDFLNTIND